MAPGHEAPNTKLNIDDITRIVKHHLKEICFFMAATHARQRMIISVRYLAAIGAAAVTTITAIVPEFMRRIVPYAPAEMTQLRAAAVCAEFGFPAFGRLGVAMFLQCGASLLAAIGASVGRDSERPPQ